jgi:hypothetical protein
MAKQPRKVISKTDTNTKSEKADSEAEQQLDEQPATYPAIEFVPSKLSNQQTSPSEIAQQSTDLPLVPTGTSHEPQHNSKLPDPHSIDQISLSQAKGGPMMRLLRNHRYKKMQIMFDKRPPKHITLQLQDAGWTYNHHDTTWSKPLGRGTEISTAIESERLFKQLANQIRESQGLDPVGGLDR